MMAILAITGAIILTGMAVAHVGRFACMDTRLYTPSVLLLALLTGIVALRGS